MAAFGTKVVVLMMVLPCLLLLLQQTSSVEAVDILYYNNTGCSGEAAEGCYAIEANTCCISDGDGAPGIQIVNLMSGQLAGVYTDGNCTTLVEVFTGPVNARCYHNSTITFSGAGWITST